MITFYLLQKEEMKMLDSTGFDLWSNGYGNCVNLSDRSNEYPIC